MKTPEEKANEFALANEEYPSFKNELETVKANCFLAGYKDCQKEYEEKLRWIPVEEKDAPYGIVQMKLENGETLFGHFTDKIKTTCNVFEFIKVTHYRELYFYKAT